MPLGHKEQFEPDFYGAVENLPFIVAEVKPPRLDGRVLDIGRLKLFCMMKLMLDSLLQNRVEEAEVVGLIFQSKILLYWVIVVFHSLRC
jgi:hypothetical protein